MWYADIFALIMVKLVGCTKYGCCVEQRLSWAFISRFYVFFSPCVCMHTRQVKCYGVLYTHSYKHPIIKLSVIIKFIFLSLLLPTTSTLIDDFVRIFECIQNHHSAYESLIEVSCYVILLNKLESEYMPKISNLSFCKQWLLPNIS